MWTHRSTSCTHGPRNQVSASRKSMVTVNRSLSHKDHDASDCTSGRGYLDCELIWSSIGARVDTSPPIAVSITPHVGLAHVARIADEVIVNG